MNFTRWLRSALAPSPRRRHPAARRLAIERLEDRLTLTAGLLDPTFGAGAGYVLSSFTNNSDTAGAVAVQSDGKIVVAGGTAASGSHTGGDFLVARYNADGSLDTSFGTGGHTATDFNRANDGANAVAIQSDGKILAAGTAQTSKGGINLALARYNPNGTLDTTFGNNGKVQTALGGNVESMAVQTDGKILVSEVNNGLAVLVRYNSNGTLDTTFGKGGELATNIKMAGGPRPDSIVIQQDGKIVLAGTTVNPSNQEEFVVARYNADGTVDTSFGSGGEVITLAGDGANNFGGVALQSDGKIVVSGNAFTGSTTDLCLVRYNPDGTLDTTFGGNGIVTVAPPAGFASVNTRGSGVEIQSDGKIVAAASIYNPSGGSAQQWSFGGARVNADGTVDTSYGNGGWATVEIDYSDYLNASALEPDDQLLLAGSAQPTSNTYPTDVALIRFTTDTTTTKVSPAIATTTATAPVTASSLQSSALPASSSTVGPATPMDLTDQVFTEIGHGLRQKPAW